ncbi:hypothetical protein UY3_10481 [Chelonia mydas]|uniref:Uncharacterized protein n=1 Tax=Chelonia mydas TaxID=8469 RepID=M7B5J3_CHEMY|nr:hypothetical protein UY3_10481 [Chelonia mydas]
MNLYYWLPGKTRLPLNTKEGISMEMSFEHSIKAGVQYEQTIHTILSLRVQFNSLMLKTLKLHTSHQFTFTSCEVRFSSAQEVTNPHHTFQEHDRVLLNFHKLNPAHSEFNGNGCRPQDCRQLPCLQQQEKACQ